MKTMKQVGRQPLCWDIAVVIGLIATVIRLGLFVKFPYWAYGDFIYDDLYMLERAQDIINGRWLGAYNYVTLIKGASFPLFVALSHWLCMPYSMLLGLFYVAAAAVTCRAVGRISNGWLGLAAYLYLLFSPIGFDAEITQRLYRNAIIFPAVLLVTGCILTVYYKRGEPLKKNWIWYALLGGSFSFFYYIREDSVWLLPLFLCGLLIIAVWHIRFSGYGKREIVKRCAALLVPIVIFGGCTAAYSFINYAAYGVGTVNDRTGGAFAALTGNMINVQDDVDAADDYWITGDTLDKVIAQCPSLQPYGKAIREQYDLWALNHPPAEGGNVRGDLSVWAFREALSRVGVYASAPQAEAFCRKVNEELLAAVSEGRLSFDEVFRFSTQTRGIYLNEIPGFLKETLKNSASVLDFRFAAAGLYTSTGQERIVEFMEGITGVKMLRPDGAHTDIRGWLIVGGEKRDNLAVCLMDSRTGEYLTERVALFERTEVAEAYPEEENALHSGLALETEGAVDLPNTEIAVFSGEELLFSTPLENGKTAQYLQWFDNLQSGVVEDANKTFSRRAVNVGNAVLRIYKIMQPLLLILALAGYAFQWARFIGKRCWGRFEPVIILTGILLSILLYEFGVTVFNSWLGSIWFYSCGAVPLGQVFVILSFVYCIRSRKSN